MENGAPRSVMTGCIVAPRERAPVAVPAGRSGTRKLRPGFPAREPSRCSTRAAPLQVSRPRTTAVGKGFEPPVDLAIHARLSGGCLRPLGHPRQDRVHRGAGSDDRDGEHAHAQVRGQEGPQSPAWRFGPVPASAPHAHPHLVRRPAYFGGYFSRRSRFTNFSTSPPVRTSRPLVARTPSHATS